MSKGSRKVFVKYVLSKSKETDFFEMVDKIDFTILTGIDTLYGLNLIKNFSYWLKNNFKTNERIKSDFIESSISTIEQKERHNLLNWGFPDYIQAKVIASKLIDKIDFNNLDDFFKNTELLIRVIFI